MFLLSISLLISIGISCLPSSEVQLVPFEANNFIVQYLPNGNLEVKPDLIQAHFDLLIKAMVLKVENKMLKNKLAGINEK